MMNNGRWRGVIVSSRLLLSLFLATSVSSSYAPDDTGSFCLDMSALPDYPGTVKRLMDSWSYRRLLAPSDGVWRRIDADNDNISVSPSSGYMWVERERGTVYISHNSFLCCFDMQQ